MIMDSVSHDVRKASQQGPALTPMLIAYVSVEFADHRDFESLHIKTVSTVVMHTHTYMFQRRNYDHIRSLELQFALHERLNVTVLVSVVHQVVERAQD